MILPLRPLLAALALLLCAAPAAAQLRGVVADAAGRPLAGATVELWSPRGRAGAALTEADGAFLFDAARAREAVTLAVRRIGYRPRTLPVPRDGEARVRLEAEPLALPALTAAVAARACPNREVPEARRLWEAARRRYAAVPAGREISVRHLVSRGEVSPGAVGELDEVDLAPSVSGYSPAYSSAVSRGVAERGYAFAQAWKAPGFRSPDPDFVAWHYPALHSWYATHFASDLFGERHVLSIRRRGAEGISLSFCPVLTDAPWIEGTIVLSPDTAFLSASWSFHTPRPDEDAGGEVAFTPVDRRDPLPPLLLPARGIFWRRVFGSEDYHQRGDVFLHWEVDREPSPEERWRLRP